MDLKVDVNNLWLHINTLKKMMGARLLAPSVSQALPLADLNWPRFRWGRFCIEKKQRINSFGDQHERRISMLKFIWETPHHHTSSRIYELCKVVVDQLIGILHQTAPPPENKNDDGSIWRCISYGMLIFRGVSVYLQLFWWSQSEWLRRAFYPNSFEKEK